MMGKDCERMISGINSIKDALAAGIASMALIISEQIETEELHISIGADDTEITIDSLKEKESEVSDILSGVISAVEGFTGDAGKMQQLGSDMYTDTTKWFNSYGSPWTEINKLTSAIESLSNAASGEIKYIGQKVALISLMNTALSYAVDAKWALATYHDYIQRGFDATYNDKEPSITHKRAKNQNSMGNLNQDYSENVNIKRPSIDPY